MHQVEIRKIEMGLDKSMIWQGVLCEDQDPRQICLTISDVGYKSLLPREQQN